MTACNSMNFRKTSKGPLIPPHPRFGKLCCAFLQQAFRSGPNPLPFPENSTLFPLKITKKPQQNFLGRKCPPHTSEVFQKYGTDSDP